MAKSDELVKYITQRVVTYIDKPKAVRRMERQSRAKPKQPWAERWFGLIPMALGMWAKEVRRGKKIHVGSLPIVGAQDPPPERHDAEGASAEQA